MSLPDKCDSWGSSVWFLDIILSFWLGHDILWFWNVSCTFSVFARWLWWLFLTSAPPPGLESSRLEVLPGPLSVPGKCYLFVFRLPQPLHYLGAFRCLTQFSKVFQSSFFLGTLDVLPHSSLHNPILITPSAYRSVVPCSMLTHVTFF